MRSRGPAVVWGVLAFIVGMLPAFWLAGPVMFGFVPLTHGVPSLGLFALAALLLAAGGGALAPAKRLAIVIGLGLPMLVVLALVRTWGVSAGVLAALFVAVAFGAAWVGTWAGARLTDMALARRSKGQ